MQSMTPRESFLQSLERCIKHQRFIPDFYDHFLSTSDEIRKKFQHTNFAQQNKMLLHSLRLAAGATEGNPESLRELKERAETHDRHHLNITPQLYEAWMDSVIATASKFDYKWNESIENSWRTVLGYVVNYMVKRY